MILTLIGYLGAFGIVVFGIRSADAVLRQGAAHALDPTAFATLTGAAALLCAYAIGLGDPVFAIANGASAVLNAIVVTAIIKARRGQAVIAS